MQPILFWLLACVVLGASLLAIAARRPARSVQLLVVILPANAAILFLVDAPLLAIEVLFVTSAAVLLVWAVLVRPRRLVLGTPGRARLNVTRFIGFFAALGLSALLLWALSRSPSPTLQCGTHQELGAGFGAWISAFLIGAASLSAWVTIRATLRRPEEEDHPEAAR